ncbi:C-type mannose receptor 2-like [Carassius auratus]|uniref:C-type mannose receptor 2-like n=1 Tax=Carassius auratus TaxID=7957 RepID=A0A6P6JV03_CARAU|nr:C-type mannose receptor 2-like [Carassius auratus]
MDGSLFVLLLLSGLFWSSSGLFRPYHYINVRMSWPEAQSYCRSKYTDLATVDSMDDVNRLVNIVDAGYSGSVWIGLKTGTQTRWVWSNGDGTVTQYRPWSAGHPISQNQCGYFNFGVWYSSPCTSKLFCVCYNAGGYIWVKGWKNWMEAQDYCRQNYIDLPSIHNSEEQYQLNSTVPSVSWVWIGLFQDSWEWSDKWSRSFRHWAADQPSQSSGSGDCVGMSRANSGKWAQYSCDLKQPFICYGVAKFQSQEYHYMNESMTWQEAQSYCKARFIDLATADTMNDVNRLVNTVDPGYSGSVWIGLHAETEYRWVWSMGDSVISQDSMWHPGQPNGDGECVMSLNGSWYDESCSTVLPFVCFNDSTGFMITKTAVSWRDAQSYCRQHHTDLASISSPEQQNLISDKSSLWIGLFLDSWEWSDQKSLSFRHWEADQPSQSSGSGDCVAMSRKESGKWARYSCDLQQPFICYGDDKLIRKQIAKLKFSCTGKCTLSDPSLQMAILNELSQKLKSMGLESDRKLSWRKNEDGEVFHRENKSTSSSTDCNFQ